MFVAVQRVLNRDANRCPHWYTVSGETTKNHEMRLPSMQHHLPLTESLLCTCRLANNLLDSACLAVRHQAAL